ncbi:MAG: Rne/Rng family ribonuclease [Acidimicrobiia bacterium]
MSDETTPAARVAADEPAASGRPGGSGGGPTASGAPDGGEAPGVRKRRRRGSRGGRNRRRRPTTPSAGEAAEDAVGPGEDHHDAAADRGSTTEDLTAKATVEAGLDKGEPAEGEEGNRQARSGSSTRSSSRRRRRGGGGRSGGAKAEDEAKEQPSRSRNRRTPSTRPSPSGAEPSPDRRRSAAPPAEDPFDPLESLDDATIERRRGRTRKGRPTGRYFMCVQVRPGGTQVAVLEGRSLTEHYVSRPTDANTQIDGNIYLGKVQNVLPGMEAAFVDIGTPKNGVLYRDDVVFDESEMESRRPKIERLLRNGQPVLVQVTKNPIGTKGARLTQEVSLAGRFVVMIPGQPGTYGISKRLSDDERKRLRRILDDIRPPKSGLIVRTAAEGASAEELARDLKRLQHQWNEISGRADRSRPAVLLHQEPDLAIRVIREEFNKEYRGIVIDDPALYDEVRRYVEAITPELADRVELYTGRLPIFERYHVHEQLHKALERKVWLPSGGSIIIERTEALTVIDVNTAKNVGRSTLEETVFANNLEAAEEVARQLRLRDIGGIIVIDFIDMEIRKNRDEVVRTFKESLARDKTRTQVFEISELGLVEMTRKRISEGLVEAFSTTCPNCEGRGIILDHSLLS